MLSLVVVGTSARSGVGTRGKAWWGEVVQIESMVGDHNTNGEAEQAVHQAQGDERVAAPGNLAAKVGS